VQAIRYATDNWGVDIIVMPFGFEEEQDSIWAAIKHADAKGVLMFAAASNDGHNRSDGVAWPARAKEVICIHSATGLGTPSRFTPGARDGQRIMVLGECVKSAWPQEAHQSQTERSRERGSAHPNALNGYKYMSGTSCATPIAAGIATTVLYYARSFLMPGEWERLRRVDCMRHIFEMMKDPDTPNYWWIRPWDLFRDNMAQEWIRGQIMLALRR
jgi:Subtilase family